MLAHIVEHRPQVLHVEQHQTTLVGDAEHDVQHAVLCLIQAHQAREQLWSHLTHRGTDGMALLAEDIVEPHRAPLPFSGLRDTTEVTLHVGHEAGHARLAEGLGHRL